MQDWEAALVAYVIALVVAQTEAAPVAIALSWGAAVFMLIDQVGSGGSTLPNFLSGISGSLTSAAPGVPAAPSGITASGQPGFISTNTVPGAPAGSRGPVISSR